MLGCLSPPIVAAERLTGLAPMLSLQIGGLLFFCAMTHPPPKLPGEAHGPLPRKMLRAYNNNTVCTVERKPVKLRQLSKYYQSFSIS